MIKKEERKTGSSWTQVSHVLLLFDVENRSGRPGFHLTLSNSAAGVLL